MLEIRDGVRWVYRGSGLTTLALATHGWFVGNAVVGVVLAPYALGMLGLTPFQFGLIGAVGGIGALLGAAITTRVGLRLGTGRTIIACHVITTVGVLVMVAAGEPTQAWASVAVLAAGQGLYGLAMGMSNSHEMSFRQLVTPDELQARTNTTLRSLNRAVMVVAAPLAGILADARGIRPTLLVAAAIFALRVTRPRGLVLPQRARAGVAQTLKPRARSISRPSSVILSGPHGGIQTQLILKSLTSPSSAAGSGPRSRRSAGMRPR